MHSKSLHFGVYAKTFVTSQQIHNQARHNSHNCKQRKTN